MYFAFSMNPELVLASNNPGKIKEIRAILPGFTLLSLSDIGFNRDIEEPFHTFRDNALIKARTIAEFSGKDVMSDDSGICIEALNGAPGVFSARYAGEPKSDERNLQKALTELQGVHNRSAYYVAVICLIREGSAHFFEGYCRGRIAHEPVGDGGFGYDPIFIPDGYDQTFGELPPDIKHRLSHRGAALRKMAAFLESVHQ